jgi:hypothetical protein
MQLAQENSRLASVIIGLVEEFEEGTVRGRTGIQYDLTPQQITQLKQAFVAARIAAGDALAAISAS